MAAVVVGVLVMALFASAFVLAGHDPEPHELPVGVVGAPADVEGVRGDLEAAAPGGFVLTTYATESSARDAIMERDVYGVMLPGQPDRLLVASSASAGVAALLEGVVAGGASQQGRTVQVEDVRPLADGDPRGTTLGLLVLPLVIAAILAGMVLALLAPTRSLAGLLLPLLTLAAAAGAILIAPARLVDALPGNLAALTAVAALAVLAIAGVARGLVALGGTRAVGAAFVVFILLGNLGSGANSAPELLPGLWRVTGPYLPPGAAATALRNVAYFDGAALRAPVVVLGLWVLAGLALNLLAFRRSRIEGTSVQLPPSSPLQPVRN